MKRRFCGKQHSKNKTLEPLAVDVSSASSKKLCLDSCSYQSNSGESKGYRLINLDILLEELSKYLICFYCGSKAVLKEKVQFGLVSEFYIDCDSCATQSTFKSSPVFESSNHDYEINIRITYAMRTLGVGLRGTKTFCSVMDLPPPVSQKTYDRIFNNIKSAGSIVAVSSMNKAAKQEIAASETNEICTLDIPWPDFEAEDLNEPHRLNQAEMSDLVRDLDLPKQKAKFLAFRLQQWNLLLTGIKITEYRTHEKNLLHFFEKKEHLMACIDDDSSMHFMDISYDLNNWSSVQKDNVHAPSTAISRVYLSAVKTIPWTKASPDKSSRE
ncbi:uncharacterized protein TNCT_649371 [Trichonephila clavata]|uniref:Mutator-like transposase domain-containing protein n=1 Tax=Trichonephila clavata TaxID=2740835 RepID=A0A8X6HLN4_TRICU|nr:uncharacterized protein TNCT_649371 [Trichonephila clavata]